MLQKGSRGTSFDAHQNTGHCEEKRRLEGEFMRAAEAHSRAAEALQAAIQGDLTKALHDTNQAHLECAPPSCNEPHLGKKEGATSAYPTPRYRDGLLWRRTKTTTRPRQVLG